MEKYKRLHGFKLWWSNHIKILAFLLSFVLVFDSIYTHIPAYNTGNCPAVYTMLEAFKIDLKSLGPSGPPVCMGDGGTLIIWNLCENWKVNTYKYINGFSMIICQLDLLKGKDHEIYFTLNLLTNTWSVSWLKHIINTAVAFKF